MSSIRIGFEKIPPADQNQNTTDDVHRFSNGVMMNFFMGVVFRLCVPSWCTKLVVGPRIRMFHESAFDSNEGVPFLLVFTRKVILARNALDSCSRIKEIVFQTPFKFREFFCTGLPNLTRVTFPRGSSLNSKIFFKCPKLKEVCMPVETRFPERSHVPGLLNVLSKKENHFWMFQDMMMKKLSMFLHVEYNRFRTIGEIRDAVERGELIVPADGHPILPKILRTCFKGSLSE